MAAVIAYDPYLKQDQVNDLDIILKSAKEVAQESDVVSVHLPLTSETKEIIDREFFGWMKPGAFLINTARGGVIPGGEICYRRCRPGRLQAQDWTCCPRSTLKKMILCSK